MTRMHKVVGIALAVVAIAAGAGVLHAQGRVGRGPGGALGGPGRFGGKASAGFALRQLDLSDAQRQQIRDLVTRRRAENQALAQRMRQAMEAQRAAITSIPVNESAVRSAAQGLADVQADIAVARAQLHADIFGLLTVEQQAKAKQLEANAKARMAERRQRAQRQPRGQV